jgi:hypothetical protein
VIEDLVTNDACHFEALLACNGIDDHVAMDTNEVLRVKNTILVLVTVVTSAAFTCQSAKFDFHTELPVCEQSLLSQHSIAQPKAEVGRGALVEAGT